MITLRRRVSVLMATILGLSVLTPSTAWAGSRIVYVPPPNGTDDTANIQAALDTCVTYSKNCTVQLAAGTYSTRQLVAYNFHGTFKGMGMSATTIQAKYPLPVNLPDVFYDGECKPNTTTCLWPSLIIFVNGKIEVSDLSMMELASPGEATTGWFFEGGESTDLIDILRFMGNLPTNASVESINVQGSADGSPTSSGFNVINGVSFVGEFPRSSKPFDYFVLSGSLKVRNSSFSTMDDGVSGAQLTSSHFIIGGSPSTGNVFENVYGGMDLESAEKSDFEISYNTSSGIDAAMWVVPYHQGLPHALLPSMPSQYTIHDNNFVGTGTFGDGFYFFDGPAKPWIQAAAWNNTIELQNVLMEGIGAYNTVGTAIWNNSITGSDGNDGIGLWNSSYDTVIDNDVSGFTVDPTGLAQIFLDPYTTYDFVLCSNSSNTVLNQGTNNLVIGCQQLDPASKSVSPAASKRSLSPHKGKPWLRQP
jgi:hypothetical protein